MSRHSTFPLIALVVLEISTGAAAQQAGSSAEEEGKAKFDAGRAALKEGDVKRALALFRASLSLIKKAGTLLNVAHCEERIGLLASAAKHYKEALALLPATDERVPLAKERIVSLGPRIPTLRIHLHDAAPTSTTVLLGEQRMATSSLDTDVPLDAGKYTITVSVDVSSTRRYDVVLEEGERESLVVSPASGTPDSKTSVRTVSTKGTAAAPRTSPPAGPPHRLRTAGFVTLGVAGIAIAASGVTGGLAFARRQELGIACPGSGPRECNPGLQPAHTEGKALANASTGLFAIAGISVVGGVTMVLLASRRSAAPSLALSLAPVLGGHQQGVMLSGAF